MPPTEDPSSGSGSVLDSGGTADRTSRDVDEVFACLADRRRRLLVECLSETSGALVVETIVENVAEREDGATPKTASEDRLAEIATTMVHVHLPKLDEAEVVDVDHETNTVREGDRFDVARSLLEVV